MTFDGFWSLKGEKLCAGGVGHSPPAPKFPPLQVGLKLGKSLTSDLESGVNVESLFCRFCDEFNEFVKSVDGLSCIRLGSLLSERYSTLLLGLGKMLEWRSRIAASGLLA